MGRVRNLNLALTESNVTGDAGEVPASVVKSAGRALQILELFDVLQRKATVTEIAELLGYPQSSTSVLLRSLTVMGYLDHDEYARTYITSSKVALLGHWSSPHVTGDGSLTKIMRRVNERTGQAVVLAVRNGLNAQYIHVVQATEALRLFVVKGSYRSLIKSGTGFALLAKYPDSEITKLAMRINMERGAETEAVPIKALLTEIETVRARGYALTTGVVTPGAGMLAMPLPKSLSDGSRRPAAIGIGAANSVLLGRLDELVAVLREELASAVEGHADIETDNGLVKGY